MHWDQIKRRLKEAGDKIKFTWSKPRENDLIATTDPRSAGRVAARKRWSARDSKRRKQARRVGEGDEPIA
jgi:hypothetical protein